MGGGVAPAFEKAGLARAFGLIRRHGATEAAAAGGLGAYRPSLVVEIHFGIGAGGIHALRREIATNAQRPVALAQTRADELLDKACLGKRALGFQPGERGRDFCLVNAAAAQFGGQLGAAVFTPRKQTQCRFFRVGRGVSPHIAPGIAESGRGLVRLNAALEPKA